MPTLLDASLVTDTLLSLPGWEGSTERIWRDVHLTPEQGTELRRQIEVDGTSLGHAPTIEEVAGATRLTLSTPESGGVTELDIALASHISDLVHRLSSSEPGIDAVRHGAPVVVVRPAEDPGGDAAPGVGTEQSQP